MVFCSFCLENKLVFTFVVVEFMKKDLTKCTNEKIKLKIILFALSLKISDS